ncbi:MAG TPA: hypothetical protein VFC63_15335 [Blastocatellia bacterium]|nr:hypothetical protein [Blastocatellia bacterium]
MGTSWEHKLYSTADNSVGGINSAIKTQEKDGWQLAALGQTEESLTFIFKRPLQDKPYVIWEHNIVELDSDENVTRRQINSEIEKAVAQYGANGWSVAAMGESPDGFFLIATRPVS